MLRLHRHKEMAETDALPCVRGKVFCFRHYNLVMSTSRRASAHLFEFLHYAEDEYERDEAEGYQHAPHDYQGYFAPKETGD